MAIIVESILARSYAFVVVSLRYLIVGGWAAAVVLAVIFLPPLSATSSGGLSDLIPPGSALVALFGRLGIWPGNRRIRPATVPEPAPPPVPAGDQP